MAGIYRLDRIAFFTYTGKSFVRFGEEELKKAALVRFEVLPEPEEKPGFEGLDFLWRFYAPSCDIDHVALTIRPDIPGLKVGSESHFEGL